MSIELGQASTGVVNGWRDTAAAVLDRRAVVAIVGCLLALLVLPPLVLLLQGSVTVAGARGAASRLSLENFTGLVGQRGFATSLYNSLVFASGSAIAALDRKSVV